MKYLILIVVILSVVGCNPYLRYRPEGTESPRKAVADEGLTTDDYIRFGSILQDYLGRPYTGRSKYVQGVDCSYFVGDVFKSYDGTELPRTVKDQVKMGSDVPFNHLQYGDLVFYRTERNSISHVGIYVGDGRFIHASTSNGVIISYMGEKYWSQRYAGARRILGVVKKQVEEQ